MSPITPVSYSVNPQEGGAAVGNRTTTPDPSPGASGIPAQVEPLGATSPPSRYPAGPSKRRLLVTSRISNQEPHSARLQLYQRDIRFRVDRDCVRVREAPSRSGTEIEGFSDNSRRRLRFVASNAFPKITSQFVLTYPAEFPNDGKISKKHLKLFLNAFRRKFPRSCYLWVLEFQRRGAPHYHLYTNLPVTDENRLILAALWVQIACGGDDAALRFHSNPRNFIAWDMGSGAYVAKYLDKQYQKDVPAGYQHCGRFWGASRQIVPLPVEVDADMYGEINSFADRVSGELTDAYIFAARQLFRWMEKKSGFRGYGCMTYRTQGYTIRGGTAVFLRLERWMVRERDRAWSLHDTINRREVKPNGVPF